MKRIGFMGLLTLISHLFFMMVTYWSLQSLKTDHWFQKGRESHMQVFYILLSLAIGYACSQFVLDLVMHSRNMLLLF